MGWGWGAGAVGGGVGLGLSVSGMLTCMASGGAFRDSGGLRGGAEQQLRVLGLSLGEFRAPQNCQSQMQVLQNVTHGLLGFDEAFTNPEPTREHRVPNLNIGEDTRTKR